MDTQTLTDTPLPGLDAVLAILNDIARKSVSSNYIYRGEPKIYPKVSSSLYRRYEEIDADGSGIEAIQEEILSQVKEHDRHMRELVDLEIMSQLQHNGGDTNLIDFTDDYLIALFFACDGEPDQPGRIILLPAEAEADYETYRPNTPLNRVIAQKSIFVRPSKGFIHPGETITIASNLKPLILDYLRRQHRISTETTYNDLHGFIRYQHIHHDAYAEYYKGITSAKNEHYEKAIEHYSETIRLNPKMASAYKSRGNAHCDLGNYTDGVADYKHALSIDPDNSEVCHNIGSAYAEQGEYQQAIEYYTQALESNYDDYTLYYRFEARLFLGDWEEAKRDIKHTALSGINLADLFREEHENSANFQQQTGITLHADIEEMLD